ncbi:hypothetical protein GPECTOR_23g23 [Gonium pectorale]|uniref:Uncharacterized protein n=1 Tax=Gonium pectorale TaxID=33097 RepID=A0A150GGW9_GONPE|nr:hypothetical protein GPECTOR_23g23 [Gonium pectorale]|eukprot:KXZ49091.1 hypothetical protein GPECTOR_23g23 [Gonium pectorale]
MGGWVRRGRRGLAAVSCSLTDVEDDGVDRPPPPLPPPPRRQGKGRLGGLPQAPPALGARGSLRGFAAGAGPDGPKDGANRGEAGGSGSGSGTDSESSCGAGGGGAGGSDSDSLCGGVGRTPPPAPDPGRSPEGVVSSHVERQSTTPPERIDPAGAQDDKQQQPKTAAPVAAARPGQSHSQPPPLDDVRPRRRVDGRASKADSGNGNGNGTGTGNGKGDTGGGGDGGAFAGLIADRPSDRGPMGVAGLPCSTVGYGTRAEVVARLPASIMLLRHAECMTLDEHQAHERVPNHDIPLSEAGIAQARQLGRRLRPVLEAAGMHLFMYSSPFLRCSETTRYGVCTCVRPYRLIAEELREGGLVSGCREAVQLREQDWGNFQDPRVQAECKEERLRYGRFYYRFPSGESVADVYDRLTIFQDHLVRDMCAGRFAENTCVAVVTHGLTLRVFAMRWMHWTVRQFLQVYNVPNAEPVLLHKDVKPAYIAGNNAHLPFMPHHTKCLYRLTPRALELLRGADPSMATSDGCWHGRLLAPPPPEPTDPEEEERQWADVDGMI